MKIVINRCWGGFGLSKAAILRMWELGYKDPEEETEKDRASLLEYGYPTCKRTDKILVQVVEELGDLVNGRFAELKVIEIPDNVDFEIYDYDGIETVIDRNRSWE